MHCDALCVDRYMKFGMTERDLDDVKHMFSDMSIKVLGLTYVISMLHMLFDVLAFKNDIGFFKVLLRCPLLLLSILSDEMR